MNQEVFIPVHYRQEVFSFIQNNVVTKEDGIGRKTTGDGLIALTNWHLFENQMEDEEDDEENDVPSIINKLLPIRPGKAAGNDLGMLDRRYLRGSELEYLAGLDDILVINDEAHHIHELKRNGSDWKILLSKDAIVTKHIIEEMARAIFNMQQNIMTTDAQVVHTLFSSVTEIKMRESYSIETHKTIYERQGYPSSRGGLERAFIDFLDTDGEVECFLKISENMHPFAVIYYMRKDGLMATYHPDFIVATQKKIYLIETKGNDKLFDKNVRQKQTAAVEWTRKINELPMEDRMNKEWEYVLISEDNFYGLSRNGATITDICDRCKVSLSAAMGELFV